MKLIRRKKNSVVKHHATFVEYAMLVGLLAIGIAVAVAAFGGKLTAFFTNTGTTIENVDGDVKKAGKAIDVPGSPE